MRLTTELRSENRIGLFILACGLVPFVILASGGQDFNVGIIFCITMSVPLFIILLLGALIGRIILYPRYRSYSPTVHCCVLGRGSIYILGTMYTLQPATDSPSPTARYLISIALEEKMIETNMTKILRLHLNSNTYRYGKSSHTAEAPVPDHFVQSVSQWMYTLAEGYTEEVINTTEGAVTQRETATQACQTVLREEKMKKGTPMVSCTPSVETYKKCASGIFYKLHSAQWAVISFSHTYIVAKG
ncbi:hypothetical protein PROFUN_11534 [Planoprotostelium fungivorum]|uniref:Uncharacterized protein n=1 Tax=Planoprotostelium fungivorum TaxID=1890364 RepID=A0A2P6NA16_9EUKA|nr:hypothetical protein PROFUN_11534 [Planoprotostelium fungivorum]